MTLSVHVDDISQTCFEESADKVLDDIFESARFLEHRLVAELRDVDVTLVGMETTPFTGV